MAAVVAGVSLSTPRLISAKSSPDSATVTTATTRSVKMMWSSSRRMGRMYVRAAPEGLSEKLATSIEDAKESCADDPASGECVAAWDTVEELSAASSHARDKLKDSDPLEAYCKDNPETDECRTYED